VDYFPQMSANHFHQFWIVSVSMGLRIISYLPRFCHLPFFVTWVITFTAVLLYSQAITFIQRIQKLESLHCPQADSFCAIFLFPVTYLTKLVVFVVWWLLSLYPSLMVGLYANFTPIQNARVWCILLLMHVFDQLITVMYAVLSHCYCKRHVIVVKRITSLAGRGEWRTGTWMLSLLGPTTTATVLLLLLL